MGHRPTSHLPNFLIAVVQLFNFSLAKFTSPMNVFYVNLPFGLRDAL